MPYDALLLDNDGVILELNEGDPDRLTRAVRAAFAEFDANPDEGHVADLVYGVMPERLHRIAEQYDVDAAALWRARDSHCSRVQCEAMDTGLVGLYDDVEALKALDQPLGMVSTNQHATLEHMFETFDLPRFETVYGREPTIESLRRKKPATHYLDCALADLDTRNSVYVGDSPHDLVAAANAGLDAAFLRRTHNHDISLTVEPTYEINNLHALPALLDGAVSPDGTQ